jgi:DNA-binding transcriptional LysR family regulator
MNLRTLRAFVEVVRQGGFSQAAEVVSLTQSSVSKAIKTLEDELGMPLLNRLGHRNELTAAGEIAYSRALVLLAEHNDLVAEINDLRGLKRGVLRIGLPPVGCGVLFATMFATYRTRYPDIDIELTEYGSKRLRECLEAGEVDLAALLLPIDEGFDYQPVRNEPLMAVLPISHPLAQRKRIDFTDLADSPFILFEAGFALNAKILAACERKGVQPRVAARSAQIDFIVDLVSAGLIPTGTSPWLGAPAPTCHPPLGPGWNWPRSHSFQPAIRINRPKCHGKLDFSFSISNIRRIPR